MFRVDGRGVYVESWVVIVEVVVFPRPLVFVGCVPQCSGSELDVKQSDAESLIRDTSQAGDSVGYHQYEGAGRLMSLFLAFAVDHVVWNLQLLQVEVMLTAVAMHAVSERPQAFAQVFWKLMHFWAACLGIGCCLRIMGWRV